VKLEHGKSYRNDDGDVARIMGPTRDNPEWSWSLAGNWYENATGRFLHYNPKTGLHYTLDESYHNLVEEVTEG
jgi:hypothetical protein